MINRNIEEIIIKNKYLSFKESYQKEREKELKLRRAELISLIEGNKNSNSIRMGVLALVISFAAICFSLSKTGEGSVNLLANILIVSIALLAVFITIKLYCDGNNIQSYTIELQAIEEVLREKV